MVGKNNDLAVSLSCLQMDRFFLLIAKSGCGGNGVPIPSMGFDLRLIRDNIEHSIAPATWDGYQSAWFVWLAFWIR